MNKLGNREPPALAGRSRAQAQSPQAAGEGPPPPKLWLQLQSQLPSQPSSLEPTNPAPHLAPQTPARSSRVPQGYASQSVIPDPPAAAAAAPGNLLETQTLQRAPDLLKQNLHFIFFF